MSDPLSVTASAAGIISLGLAVCGEIAAFGRAYRDYGEDIRNMTTKAESLCVPLKALREMIEDTRITQPEMTADLSEKAQSINSSIMRLQDILKRYGPKKTPDGFPDRAHNQLKKAIYHFRKDTLREMGADLDRMQTILQTALAVYQWKNTITIAREIQEMRMMLGTMPAPSLLKDLCDTSAESQHGLNLRGNRKSTTRRPILVNQDKVRLKKNFSIYSRWLGVMIMASLGMSTGAGGVSISPMLRIQIVSRHSESEEKFLEIIYLQDGRGDETALVALQDHFTTGKLHPSLVFDDIFWGIRSPLDLVLHLFHDAGRKKLPVEIIGFLLDNGIRSIGMADSYWNTINSAWFDIRLGQEDMPLIERLVDAGCHFDLNHPIFTDHAKHNLKLILSRNDELIDVPDAVKLICREDAQELREAICQGRIVPNQQIQLANPLLGEPLTLLDLVFGWEEGLKIFLESGANVEMEIPCLTFPGSEYHHCAKMLLEAGCFITKGQLNEAINCHDEGERMRLLVSELASRRKRLQALAEALLPSTMIPSSKTSLLDGPESLEVYNLLLSHKSDTNIRIPPHKFFFPSFTGRGETVHDGVYEKQCAEALFNTGFRCSDKPDLDGKTPIGSLMVPGDRLTPRGLLGIIEWHILKGANLHRRLPWTNEPVAYLILVKFISMIPLFRWQGQAVSQVDVVEIKYLLKRLGQMGRDLFLAPDISNECSCPCSPNKCTGLSAIMRQLTWKTSGGIWDDCFRLTFSHILDWEQLYWNDALAFIRSITFNALDLTHTCFDNTRQGYLVDRNCWPDDESFINEHWDHEESLVEFETLLEELNVEFDELGLPLREFLSGYWYRRVKDHILTPQSPDEQHINNAREFGVELEFSGLAVPEWIEVLFGSKVEEVGDKD